MLNLGLTGGIGAGKSAASAAFADLGAIVIDADKIAREVVEPGTDGLAQVVDAFGPGVLDADGALDRPALAKVVFGDDAARSRLNHIVHPLVRARSDELMAQGAGDDVVVNDIPLLAEGDSAPAFHLVMVVTAPVEIRLERLVGSRGMDEQDARARIEAQASDDDRARIADVLLDNSGEPGQLRAQIDDLWAERISPYAAGLELRSAAVDRLKPREGAAERELARLSWVLRPAQVTLEREGDLVRASAGGDEVRSALAAAGWFGERRLRSADPGAVLTLELP